MVHKLLAFLLVAALGLFGCGDRPQEGDARAGDLLVIEGATVFTSAMTDPIDDGVVVILDGVIEAVGFRGEVQIPPAARRVAAAGLSILPGFWNADVRADEELLELAASGSSRELGEALQERFTRYGFTTIVETATPMERLTPLLDRIGGGEVGGPRVVATEGRSHPDVIWAGGGEDLDPLAAWQSRVQASPSDAALVPSLTRMSTPRPGEPPEAAVARTSDLLDTLGEFVARGGALVFGSGAGYVPEFDPGLEYLLMEEGGVPAWQVLDALTFEPAVRFGHGYTGLVEPGMVADLVVVDGDPWGDPGALQRVLWVLREGRTVYGGIG
jgi:imidazolonepropionase-like amidohydrolase